MFDFNDYGGYDYTPFNVNDYLDTGDAGTMGGDPGTYEGFDPTNYFTGYDDGTDFGGGFYPPEDGGFGGGSFLDSILGTLSTLGTNALGNLTSGGNLANILAGLYGAHQSGQAARDQGFYGDQLKSLYQNPQSFTMNPAYQTMYDQGLEAVNRTASAKGMLGSGNRLLELQSTGAKLANLAYNDEANRLASLAGQRLPMQYANLGEQNAGYGDILRGIFKNPVEGE